MPPDMLEAPPLNGAYAYLSQCDDHKIKMIMRDSKHSNPAHR